MAALLTLLSQYAEQVCETGRASVRPSVYPIDRMQWRAAGLLLSAPRPGGIDRYQATALGSKCGQCHVDSRGTRLDTDLLSEHSLVVGVA